MALTLLDYLFHREVQAMSNLSGQGKHGKKQLDPLMIYGIRCKSSRVDITIEWSYKVLHFLASLCNKFFIEWKEEYQDEVRSLHALMLKSLNLNF